MIAVTLFSIARISAVLGALVQEIKVERTVRFVLQRYPIADGKPVQAIGDLKALLIVARDRLESVHGWRGVFLAVDGILGRAVDGVRKGECFLSTTTSPRMISCEGGWASDDEQFSALFC